MFVRASSHLFKVKIQKLKQTFKRKLNFSCGFQEVKNFRKAEFFFNLLSSKRLKHHMKAIIGVSEEIYSNSFSENLQKLWLKQTNSREAPSWLSLFFFVTVSEKFFH